MSVVVLRNRCRCQLVRKVNAVFRGRIESYAASIVVTGDTATVMTFDDDSLNALNNSFEILVDGIASFLNICVYARTFT